LTYDKNEKEFRRSLVSVGYFIPPNMAFFSVGVDALNEKQIN
jgi:hypothetical protein